MGHIVLNCRDLEHRSKAIERLYATGRGFFRIPDNDGELQIGMMYDGELSFDTVNPDETGVIAFTKIKPFIKAIDERKPLTKE